MHTSNSTQRELERLFPGDGEMTALMRLFDWSKTDLGPPESWPQNLQTVTSVCLMSRFPIVMWWGPDFNILYNDAYIPFLGHAKHPGCLGQAGKLCWPEIWDVIEPMMREVRTSKKAKWCEDFGLFFARNLPREEVYVRFTYDPILAADGYTVDGIFNPCTETTEQVIGARRLETLRKLGVRSLENRTVEAVCQQAVAVLSENPRDLLSPQFTLWRIPGRKPAWPPR